MCRYIHSRKIKQSFEELSVYLGRYLLGGDTEVREWFIAGAGWGVDCQDYWRWVTAGRGVRVIVRIIAFLSKVEKHEGRPDRGRILDLDREEKIMNWIGQVQS